MYVQKHNVKAALKLIVFFKGTTLIIIYSDSLWDKERQLNAFILPVFGITAYNCDFS